MPIPIAVIAVIPRMALGRLVAYNYKSLRLRKEYKQGIHWVRGRSLTMIAPHKPFNTSSEMC